MGVLEQLLALMRWKRMILLNTAVVAAASVVVALLLPQWYRSTASIFPPEDDSWVTGNISSLVSVATLGMTRRTLPIWGSPSDVYAAVLKSRSVRAEIIRRFDMMKELKAKDMDQALRRLKGRVKVEVTGEGLVSVRVQDRSPQKAADMANAMVELLDQINREKRNVAGRQARVFLEGRLEQNRRELAAAEESLRVVQERTGVLIPDEQLKSVITAAADLNTQLILEEVDLAAMRAQVGPDHPDRKALEREVAALRRKVAEIDEGTTGSAMPDPEGPRSAAAGPGPSDPGALSIPLKQYPVRSMEAVRALREVKVQEAIYEFLSQQFENYRIEEKRDTPTVQVLDTAVPATRRSLPIRWLICTSATLIALVLSLLLAAGLEALSRMRRESPERFEKVRELAREVGLTPLVDRL
jgi:tyrosine-protein kinase Etk/Wzc